MVPPATLSVTWSARVVQAPKRKGQARGSGAGLLAQGGLWGGGSGGNKARGYTLGRILLARLWRCSRW